MDNNYLYIVGFLGIVLVAFVVFYYLKRKQKQNNSLENMESSKIQQDIQDEPKVECDGDKCFIKHRQTKYDKCDGEKCI